MLHAMRCPSCLQAARLVPDVASHTMPGQIADMIPDATLQTLPALAHGCLNLGASSPAPHSLYKIATSIALGLQSCTLAPELSLHPSPSSQGRRHKGQSPAATLMWRAQDSPLFGLTGPQQLTAHGQQLHAATTSPAAGPCPGVDNRVALRMGIDLNLALSSGSPSSSHSRARQRAKGCLLQARGELAAEEGRQREETLL